MLRFLGLVLAAILLLPFPCVFRRSRPGIPSEVGHPFQLKPARDSDDPGHLLGLLSMAFLCRSVNQSQSRPE